MRETPAFSVSGMGQGIVWASLEIPSKQEGDPAVLWDYGWSPGWMQAARTIPAGGMFSYFLL